MERCMFFVVVAVQNRVCSRGVCMRCVHEK